MDDVKISVIMLTYNREKFIRRSIESVLSQTFTDFEFIIVDNGSTDNSGRIADKYAEKDKRVNVFHRNKGNIGSGRNSGLDLSHGDYIAFIDDDDWLETDFLEFLYSLIKENNADVSICGSYRESGGEVFPNFVYDKKFVLTAEQAIITLLERKKFNIAFPTKLFKREMFNGLRFPECGKYDDIMLMHLALANANRVVLNGVPKYIFFRHSGNNSAFTGNDKLITPLQLDEYFEAYHLRTLFLCDKFPSITLQWKYFEWSFLISMINKIISNNLAECEKQLEYARNILRRDKAEFLKTERIQDFESEWVNKYL